MERRDIYGQQVTGGARAMLEAARKILGGNDIFFGLTYEEEKIVAHARDLLAEASAMVLDRMREMQKVLVAVEKEVSDG